MEISYIQDGMLSMTRRCLKMIDFSGNVCVFDSVNFEWNLANRCDI